MDISWYWQSEDEEGEEESSGEDKPPRYGSKRRRKNTRWCSCGKCCKMDDPRECICCQELKPMENKMADEGVRCITLHPGFDPVVLNPYVLETAYYSYRKHQHPNNSVNNNRKYRYTAYRQLVRWCWGILGKNNRVPLPACAICEIRNEYKYADE